LRAEKLPIPGLVCDRAVARNEIADIAPSGRGVGEFFGVLVAGDLVAD